MPVLGKMRDYFQKGRQAAPTVVGGGAIPEGLTEIPDDLVKRLDSSLNRAARTLNETIRKGKRSQLQQQIRRAAMAIFGGESPLDDAEIKGLSKSALQMAKSNKRANAGMALLKGIHNSGVEAGGQASGHVARTLMKKKGATLAASVASKGAKALRAVGGAGGAALFAAPFLAEGVTRGLGFGRAAENEAIDEIVRQAQMYQSGEARHPTGDVMRRMRALPPDVLQSIMTNPDYLLAIQNTIREEQRSPQVSLPKGTVALTQSPR